MGVVIQAFVINVLEEDEFALGEIKPGATK